jgi:xanthine dehydrogenase iron-sulfur cluster and FAD-binding subunit A
MKPGAFSYVRPVGVREAIAALVDVPGAMPLAGGQSLVGLLNLRRARPPSLVDLSAIAELAAIEARDGELVLGAMVPLARAARDAGVAAWAPLLVEAIGYVASAQVRARSTLGGSVAHADPVGEVVTALTALEARVTLRGPEGERTVAIEAARAELRPGELIVALRVPATLGDGAFAEVAPRYNARALAGAAVVARRDDAGRLAALRVVVAGVASAPTAVDVARLIGLAPDDPAVDEALDAAVGALPAADDPRADVGYRRQAASALAARALRRAASGAAPADDATGPGPPAAAAAGPAPPPAAAPRPAPATGATEIALTVNGLPVREHVEPRLLLSDLLRHRLGLTATHVGCEHGVCGACNVLIDGVAVRSCLTLAIQAEGRAVRTVEGLRDDGELDALTDAFVEHHALQCGFCTPGFLVTLAELGAGGAGGADGEIGAADLAGNLCRCTGYGPIVAAARAAAP